MPTPKASNMNRSGQSPDKVRDENMNPERAQPNSVFKTERVAAFAPSGTTMMGIVVQRLDERRDADAEGVKYE
jgi:hypothetical protein